MIFKQNWQGAVLGKGRDDEFFPCAVPGNIQLDFAKAAGLGDPYYSDNCTKLKEYEDVFWKYKTNLEFTKQPDEKVFFVTKGI